MSKNYFEIDRILDEIVLGNASEEKLAEMITNEDRNELLQELLLHQSAAVMIQRNAVLEQVSAVHNRFIERKNGFTQEDFPESTLLLSHKKPNYRIWWSIAAMFIIAPALFLLYTFIANSSDNLYNEQYQAYRINVDRSSAPPSKIGMAEQYQKGDFKSVISYYTSSPVHDLREDMIAGFSYMELKEYDNAIPLFDGVIKKNIQTGNNLYHDEAEYYLALAYLSTNKPEKAYELFNKIYLDVEHTFNGRVNKWFMIRLKWL